MTTTQNKELMQALSLVEESDNENYYATEDFGDETAELNEFVKKNSNKSLSGETLTRVYFEIKMRGLKEFDGDMLWVVDMAMMTLEDFCWIWFMCLNNREFVDLVVGGPLTAVRQVYTSMNKRMDIYSDKLKDIKVDGNLDIMKALEGMGDRLDNLTKIFKSFKNRVVDYMMLLGGRDVPSYRVVAHLRKNTVEKTGVKASGWNASMVN